MNSRVRTMVECSMLIALATVLSLLKLVDLPYGGSVTCASMLPIVIIAYRHGIRWGLVSGLVYGVIQQLLGLHTLTYVTTWQSILAVILLDYVLAFTVMGLGGVFRRACPRQSTALFCGALLGCFLRYLMHVISGATVWAGLSIPTTAALAYSLSYNATYMLPEAIILAAVALYLGSVLDFRPELPVRMTSDTADRAVLVCQTLSGLSALIGTVVAAVTLFPSLQDPESGDFDITRLTGETLAVPGIALGIGLFLCGALLLAAVIRDRKTAPRA